MKSERIGCVRQWLVVERPHATPHGHLVVGVLQNKPQNVGMAGTIGIFGVSNVLAGAAVTAGDLLAPDATGRAVTDNVHGKWLALASTTVVGSMIPALKV